MVTLWHLRATQRSIFDSAGKLIFDLSEIPFVKRRSGLSCSPAHQSEVDTRCAPSARDTRPQCNDPARHDRVVKAL